MLPELDPVHHAGQVLAPGGREPARRIDQLPCPVAASMDAVELVQSLVLLLQPFPVQAYRVLGVVPVERVRAHELGALVVGLDGDYRAVGVDGARAACRVSERVEISPDLGLEPGMVVAGQREHPRGRGKQGHRAVGASRHQLLVREQALGVTEIRHLGVDVRAGAGDDFHPGRVARSQEGADVPARVGLAEVELPPARWWTDHGM